ncbi:MAG: Rne/Rng family ribonuclease, partial [Candidatus Kapabacteria bacterium]|nr:Rne/Rng family ribonuclease [Candidatus Kapabacteria bacterium]
VIGVSKKIASFKERKRLRQLAKQVMPQGTGCIIRTASQNQSDVELRRDWETLLDQWNTIERKVKLMSRPGMLYKDASIANSVIRDLLTKDVSRIITDNKKLYNEITKYVDDNAPALSKTLQHFAHKEPLFEAFDLQHDIDALFARKVNLPSGGYIIFDHTEAMLVIDVNTGRATFDSDQEINALKTNMESVYEVARQLRLRDVGGMIVIDFIDMQDERNRIRLFNEMKRELSNDKAKTVVYPLTQLGLLQITRQRIRTNITEWVTEVCTLCHGVGRITSKSLLVKAIDRWLYSFRRSSREFRLLLVVHPDVASYISEGTFSTLTTLMLRYFVKISIQTNEAVPVNEFQMYSQKTNKNITKEYL